MNCLRGLRLVSFCSVRALSIQLISFHMPFRHLFLLRKFHINFKVMSFSPLRYRPLQPIHRFQSPYLYLLSIPLPLGRYSSTRLSFLRLQSGKGKKNNVQEKEQDALIDIASLSQLCPPIVNVMTFGNFLAIPFPTFVAQRYQHLREFVMQCVKEEKRSPAEGSTTYYSEFVFRLYQLSAGVEMRRLLRTPASRIRPGPVVALLWNRKIVSTMDIPHFCSYSIYYINSFCHIHSITPTIFKHCNLSATFIT